VPLFSCLSSCRLCCYNDVMDMPLSERRQIENEMIFRRANEMVGDDLDRIDADYRDEGNPELARNDDLMLHFSCECSDENCYTRIPMKLSTYQKIHENRDAFIIKSKHQVEKIEKVVLVEDDYCVVVKNNSIAEPGAFLNKTSSKSS